MLISISISIRSPTIGVCPIVVCVSTRTIPATIIATATPIIRAAALVWGRRLVGLIAHMLRRWWRWLIPILRRWLGQLSLSKTRSIDIDTKNCRGSWLPLPMFVGPFHTCTMELMCILSRSTWLVSLFGSRTMSSGMVNIKSAGVTIQIIVMHLRNIAVGGISFSWSIPTTVRIGQWLSLDWWRLVAGNWGKECWWLRISTLLGRHKCRWCFIFTFLDGVLKCDG